MKFLKSILRLDSVQVVLLTLTTLGLFFSTFFAVFVFLPVLYAYRFKTPLVGRWVAVGPSLLFLLLGLADSNQLGYAVVFFLIVGLPGIVFGELLTRRNSLTLAIGKSVVAVTIFLVIASAATEFMFRQSMWGAVEAQSKMLIQEVYTKLSSQDVERFGLDSGQLHGKFMAELPSNLIIILSVAYLINFLFVASWTPRLKARWRAEEQVRNGYLVKWKVPEQLIWLTIGLGGVYLTAKTLVKVPVVEFISWNGLRVLLFCYGLQGLSILGYFLKQFRLFIALKMLLFFLFLFAWFLPLCLGLFDMWIDFRKYINKWKPAR